MTTEADFVRSPDDANMKTLSDQLRERSLTKVGDPNGWPTEQLSLLDKAGVYHWFVPESLGGMGWSSPEIVSGYFQLASACLKTTFILTQRVAAIRRICSATNEELRSDLLPGLLDGSEPATIGISHLTTSRQHVREPVLRAEQVDEGFVIDGFSPWVTGAAGASNLVMGAEMTDGRQVLFVVSTNDPGIVVEPGFQLVALTGSQTGAVRCNNISIGADRLLAGPVNNVLANGQTPTTGSFQTSALAVGLTQSATDFIRAESSKRPKLFNTLTALEEQLDEIKQRLIQLASGIPICSNEELRTDANSLVLRATQSALVAAKGAGYVEGHPVGRWCQEALFFLVWSCPQAVLNANLCEFAGIE